MALRILDAPSDPAAISRRIRDAVAAAIPGAEVEVAAAGAGHFELRVTSPEFAGLTKLRQHQIVYTAIAPLMSGDAPPVHAIDRLECRVP
jgi:stress-induced morphogen